MRYILLTAFLIMGNITMEAQDNLSPFTKMLLDKVDKHTEHAAMASAPLSLPDSLRGEFLVHSVDYVRGTILTDSTFDKTSLAGTGIIISTEAGFVLTVDIPILQIRKLATITGIKYIDIDRAIPVHNNPIPLGKAPSEPIKPLEPLKPIKPE